MLKKHMAACLVATAFAAAPALAQTTPAPSAGTDRPVASGSGSTTSGSPAMQPGASSGSMGAAPTAGSGSAATPASPPQMTASGSGGAQGQFMTQLQPNQMMASKLIGTTVVGANNESIGDINDVLVDRNGQALAVVIGVGGFLGIGEKDVAVPFQQLDFASSQQNQQTSGSSGSGTSGSGSTGTNTVNTTGSTGTAGSGSAGSGDNSGVPDRILLRMTKADLQAAPTFATSSRNQGGNAGGTTAPKP